jgi:hypothetical protein
MAALATVLQFAGLGPSGISVRPGGDVPTVPPTPTASTAAPGRAASQMVPAVSGMAEAQADAVLRAAGFHEAAKERG